MAEYNSILYIYLNIKRSCIHFYFICMSVVWTMYVPGASGGQRDVSNPLEVEPHKLLCGCWKLSLVLLQEWQVCFFNNRAISLPSNYHTLILICWWTSRMSLFPFCCEYSNNKHMCKYLCWYTGHLGLCAGVGQWFALVTIMTVHISTSC